MAELLLIKSLIVTLMLNACNGKKSYETGNNGEEGGVTDTAYDTTISVNDSNCKGDYWIQVTTGTYLTCGLDNEGCADCWGNQSLNSDTDTYAWEPTGDDMPPDEVFAHISLPPALPEGGGWNGCGLTGDKRAVCWGQVEDPPAIDFSFVATGKYSACALDSDGMIDCWGNNEGELVGLASGPFLRLSVGEIVVCGIATDNSVSCGSAFFYPGEIIVPKGGYIDIDTSYQGYACALSEESSMVCWSEGGDLWTYPVDPSVIDIEVGGFDHCMLNTEGRISCLEGKRMPPDKVYTQMDLGWNHGCAVDIDGNIECWGWGELIGAMDVPALPE